MIAIALALQTVFWLSVLAFFMAQRSASLFHPLAFYLAFHFLVFVLRPLMVYVLGFDSQWFHMRFTPTPDVFVLTLLISSYGLLVFAVFALAAGDVRAAVPKPVTFAPAERSAFMAVFLLLLPLALYSAWLDARIFGTLSAVDGLGMRVDPASGHTVFVGTTGYLAKAHNLLIPLTALFVWVNRFRWWAWLPVLVFLGWRAYLGSRWGVVIVLAILLLLHLHAHRRRWLRPLTVALAVPVFLLFHAVGEQRQVFRDLIALEPTRILESERGDVSFVQSLDKPDFANFDFLAFIVEAVPERAQTYSYFTQHLALFTQPVPRMLWPGKPVAASLSRVQLNDHGWFGHRTRSLVGDGWMSLGWIGVSVMLALSGWLLGRAHRWFRRRQDAAFPVAAYCCLLPTSLLWFRGGNIVTAVELAMWMLLPVALWWGLARVLRHASDREGARA